MAGFADPPQHQLLGLFQAGQYREVLQRAQALNLRLEQDPIAAQIVAGALFQLGEFAKAARLLEPHQAALGADGSYLSLYGATCRRLGQLNSAKDLLSRALALDPQAPQIRNNYANLLIDLGELAEARRLLEGLLAEDPSYADARANLNRLQFREQQSAPALAPNASTTAAAPATALASAQSWMPQDPLMLAFAEDEVRQAGAVAFSKPAPNSAAALARQLPDPDKAAVAADQLKLAAQAIQENNPAFALQLVSQAGLALGAQAAVYVNAADAYIRLQRFHEAEICLLHALQLGGPALPHYINLITLASMRGDCALARHYIDAAAAIDPKHPQLAQVREQVQRQEAGQGSRYSFVAQWALPNLTPAPPVSAP
ncbi:tetratricopeptide repeat protein [Cyanobium sp. ATX 6E8]|uniref:tetratricopeptide repeat protein n=1 Tax=Cyanobium sp. ATX 6E8 TaxID=2823701 RepID=UPI0020CEFBCB|nr:tetratricopeptide repeat protein [Cyanobium sp. ATX 6E8]MCP9941958.1 tetratricopeptide repeat protein [Cyanobium sp. ATX 6E8]